MDLVQFFHFILFGFPIVNDESHICSKYEYKYVFGYTRRISKYQVSRATFEAWLSEDISAVLHIIASITCVLVLG